MAMEYSKSSGEITLLNQPVEKIDIEGTGRYIGLCPQYNSIWERLTVDESLEFFARLRGLSGEDREFNKKLIKKTLELNEFGDVRAGNLSGGNKRKLCCA